MTDQGSAESRPERLPALLGHVRFAAALAAEADQHRATSARLQAKWIFHLTGAKDLEAPPIVYKGVMYVGQYNRVHALDAATGRLIWEYMRQPPSVGWQRGIGIYGDMVYMVAQDSALVALDRRTGNPLWEARPSQPGKRFQGPMPFAAKGLIIMSGSGQGGGFIEAFDARTGKSKWTWNVDSRSRASRAAKPGRATRGGTAAARCG